MKHLTFLAMTLCLLAVQAKAEEQPSKEKEGIFPKVTQRFGQVVKVKVTFVEKPRTYWAQNIAKKSAYAKIIEVNGKKLEQPVVMEYQCHGVDFKKGQTLTLTAYENLESFGTNREWDGKLRQFNYTIKQFIVLRNPSPPKAKAP